MKTFEIRKLNGTDYSYLVLSTSYVNPIENLSEIEKNLEDSLRIKVLFDLLLSNGNSTNRFIEGIFDGKRFIDFKVCENVDSDIKKESGKYYQENLELLHNSVLSGPQRFLISKGKVLSSS